MRALYIREQKHILGTSDYAEVDLFETTDKEHTASTRRKRELATSIAQQKYNDMIARRYFCQLAYTNFGESDWAVTFTYDHGHQPVQRGGRGRESYRQTPPSCDPARQSDMAGDQGLVAGQHRAADGACES